MVNLKTALFLAIMALLIGQASASTITIDSDKFLNISGVRTFPVYMYAVCHESVTANCTTNALNNTNFTFHIPYSDASPSDATLTTWQQAFEGANIFWNTRTTTTGNVYVAFNETKEASSKFFGYHQIDEPTGTSPETIENLTTIYNQVKANDSIHPISVNFGRGAYNPWLWNVTGDILMWDGYSIKQALDTDRGNVIMDWDLRAYSQLLAKSGNFNPYHNYSKPWFVTIQANGANTTLLRIPTEPELRALTYAAISQDPQGIGFWGYALANGSGTSAGLSVNASLFAYADQLAREITGMNNVMVLPTQAHAWYGEADWTNVTITPNPTRTIETYTMYDFSYILKNDSVNNKYYLIVVNKANVSKNDRQINITALAGTGSRTVTTLGLETSGSQAAGRTLTSVNGVFNDSFDAYAAHIYEILSVSIEYSSDTPANQSIVAVNHILVNTSIDCSGNCSWWIDWDKLNVLNLHFSETTGTAIFDSSSYGNAGTYNGNTTINSTLGRFGNAAAFDGINDNITIPDSASLNITEDISMVAVVNITNRTGNEDIIIKGTSYNNNYNLWKRNVTNNDFGCSIMNSTGSIRITFGNYVVGTLVQVACTWNDTEGVLRGYVNDTQYTPTPIFEAQTPVYGQLLKIGHGNFGWFNGSVDEIRLEKRKLAWDEINSSWDVVSGTSLNQTNLADGNYNATAFVQDSTGTIASTETRYWTVDTSIPTYTPPTPTSLSYTTGNFWVNYTWQAGSGNVTNSFNVSQNGTWTNGTTTTFMNTNVGAHGWSNISVYAFNNSGSGTLNQTPASTNTQVPNNVPVLDAIGNKNVTAGSKGTLNTTTGNFNWSPASGDIGTYTWNFNSSDAYGGVDDETITVSVEHPGAPVISIINNTATGDASIKKIFLDNSESITFFADADQTITTWNWYIDNVLQSNNFDFDYLTTSWSKGKYHYISLNGSNTYGTSNTLTWGVNVYPAMATATIGALNETPADEIRAALENKDAPALVMATGLPFTNLIGAFFYAIVWFTVFVMMWIKTKSMNIPMIIGIVFGGLIISFLPEQYALVATALIVLGLFATIYIFFKGRG